MGAMSELDIARQELEASGLYRVITIEEVKERNEIVREVLDFAGEMLFGALLYARNPYQHGETEYDEWRAKAVRFIVRYAPEVANKYRPEAIKGE